MIKVISPEIKEKSKLTKEEWREYTKAFYDQFPDLGMEWRP
jgi:hypothetical protein|tara:strand:+ start:12989 stop:13111 length:123 start_codon:yes stop_codon:yes gene_type:complete